MAANKKHHFVPQFYLKNFSVDSNRATINLYNHKNRKFIEGAPIKGQAYDEYLYGNDDEVEKELSKLESEAAKLLADPITKIVPPQIGTHESRLLKEFILVQLFRTIKAGDEAIEAINEGFRKLMPFLGPKFDLRDGEISHKHPSLVSLLHAIDNLHLMNFLGIKSFVNLSELPFITSDTPVVLYNQFMEKRGYYNGATGIAVKGLQIFFPIHPRLMYCLFDPFTYDCGEEDNTIVKIESWEDIHQLNVLQYLFSNTQLYFDNSLSREYIETFIINDFNKHRISSKSKSTISSSKSQTGERKLYLFNTFEDPHFQMQLSFMKPNVESDSVILTDGLPIPRHSKLKKTFDTETDRIAF